MDSEPITSWQEANEVLSQGHPSSEDILNRFPFSEYLKKLWNTGEEYQKHGRRVLNAMNILLSGNPEEMLAGKPTDDQVGNLKEAITSIRRRVGWGQRTEALFRIAAFYHDIGKYIIRERHPIIGWHIVQYINAEEKDKLRNLLEDEQDFRLLMTILRDHDQFGVLSTGEASYPILLRAVSVGESLEAQKRITSSLCLCNLADVAGTLDEVDADVTDRLIYDLNWFVAELEYCWKERTRLVEHVINKASEIPLVHERIRRLLLEASRDWPDRHNELKKAQLVHDRFDTVFESENARREFASQFTHVCKLDYGKRFFAALMQYCEGPSEDDEDEQGKPPFRSKERMRSEDVIYAVFAVLKRITTSYSAMMRSDSSSGNLIGVELKDLTPRNAPEKTARIIDLIITSHYPGLTWMMSDAPAWYF